MRKRDELWLAGDDDVDDGGVRVRVRGVESVVVYLVVPLVLTVLAFPRSVGGWVEGYGINFVVGLCIAGSMELLYHQVWPRILPRLLGGRRAGRAVQIGAHASTLLVAVFGGGEIAARVCALVWDFDLARARSSIHRTALTVSLVVVVLLLVHDRLRARARTARLVAVRAQLDALVARTNPHFLFNSLNSVAALIPEDAARAEAMLERLAALFRYALEGARRRTVALGEEIAIVRDYLDIEGIRLGERLVAEVHVEDGLAGVAVPPLCLQPLVENAIVHAIAPRRGPGRVDVRVERHAPGAIAITVDDDGDGRGAPAHTGSGSALADLRTRLELLHGAAASLEAGPREGGGWRARLVVPA